MKAATPLLDSPSPHSENSRMPTLRPLAFAVIIAVLAGLAAPDAIAQKKKRAAKKAKAPPVAAACLDFYADANASWLAANPMPASGAISSLGQLTARAQLQQRELLDAAMASPQGNVQTLLGDFWASGQDEASIERDGAIHCAPAQRIDAIRRPRDIARRSRRCTSWASRWCSIQRRHRPRELDRHLGISPQAAWASPTRYYTRATRTPPAPGALHRLRAEDPDPDRRAAAAGPGGSAIGGGLETRIATASRPLQDRRDPRANFAPVPTTASASNTATSSWTRS